MAVATGSIVLSMLLTALYAWYRVVRRLSLSLLIFGAILLIHGVPLSVYLFVSGPDTLIYEKALNLVDREEVLSTLLFAVSLMFTGTMVGSELSMASFWRWRRGSKCRSSTFVHTDLDRIWMGTVGARMLGTAAQQEHVETYLAVAEITRGSLLSTSNAMFIGDAWAQYSWAGVIGRSLLARFLVRAVDIYKTRRGYTDPPATLGAGCSFGIFTMLSTSFTTAWVTGGLLLVPLLSLVFGGRSLVRRPPAP